MAVEKIIQDWKKGHFLPICWLEGEESYYIDKVVGYAESNLLPASEAAFNLTVFYGKDAQWQDVINACRRYPMFGTRQVVILKEAQQMKDIEKLEAYVENPLQSTLLVVAYKDKKLDARRKFAKSIKEKGVLLTTKKLYENQVRPWTEELLRSKGLIITQKALALLVDAVGNDLSRIDNEISKISVNLGERTQITDSDIEEFIGVSKEFNVFELQTALAARDLPAAIRIIQYFEANPKAGPIQMVLPSLYSFFSKIYMMYGTDRRDDQSLASMFGIPPFVLKDYKTAAKNFNYEDVEKALLLLHHYNLRSVGVNDSGTTGGSLLKEMVVKMIA
ncbi:MAG TPA: DNA polymerase III subunit delta [Chitinophagaceae bacterium]|nr:DNA polymerase III subunit delta [Chitinophagaceae bacterium]